MSEMKTTKNDTSVEKYLNSIDNEQRKGDCLKIYELMKEITQEDGAMWGDSIVGFGSYHYKYESGREGDWFLTGFSNRKQSISIYITAGFTKYKALLEDLGNHKTGKSCLYIKSLDEVDKKLLRELIENSVEEMNKKYN